MKDCELVIIGMVGLRPSMKEEVPNTVRRALGAGVKLRFISGDSREVATDLGLQAGLIVREELSDPYVCMSGEELVKACTVDPALIDNKAARDKVQKRKKEIVPRLQILCRATPKHTEFLIRILKEFNRVVAATGKKA